MYLSNYRDLRFSQGSRRQAEELELEARPSLPYPRASKTWSIVSLCVCVVVVGMGLVLLVLLHRELNNVGSGVKCSVPPRRAECSVHVAESVITAPLL